MADTTVPLLFNVEDIVETVREPILVLSADLRVRRANRSFYRTFKVTPEETVDRLVYDLGNRQWDIPALRKLLEEVLPQNTIFDDFEVVHEFDSIGRKIMLLNARRIYHEGYDTEFILLAIEDITERRRLEEQRRELEIRFTSLVRNIKDHSIFTLDPQGKITSWNVEAERILGWSEAEALGQHFSIIFTPEDLGRNEPETELRTAREKGRAEDERWHIRKSGEWFWALGIVTATHDAEGNIAGYSKILRDMTDRKRAEEALGQAHQELERRVAGRTKDLRESEERFRATFDQAAVGIAHIAPDGKFLRVNQKLSEILGYSPDELMTRTFQEITHPEDLDADLENVWRVLGGDIKTYSMEKRYYRKDESLVWINLTVALVRDDAGQPKYFISVIEDISRRKSVEEQLSSERQLLTKLLDLQEQERQMVSQDIHDGFVQDVVGAHLHLQAIHGAVDSERMQFGVGLVAALLQKAITEGRRLIRDLRPMVLDESGVVEAIVHLIADEEKNEGFTVAFTHDVKFDRLDPRLEGTIFRIVQEALNNVKRHGQIDHAAVRMTQTNGTLQLVVRDHGVGFDLAHVSQDRFGLRGICERARLYGGTAMIETVPAGGTTVTVQLPLKSHAVGNVS